MKTVIINLCTISSTLLSFTELRDWFHLLKLSIFLYIYEHEPHKVLIYMICILIY